MQKRTKQEYAGSRIKPASDGRDRRQNLSWAAKRRTRPPLSDLSPSPTSALVRTRLRVPERTQSQLLEGLGDIGAPVLGRLEPTGPHETISVLVPFAVGEVVPEHGGRGLCLANNADGHIGFSQARQRLLDVARGLVLRDHRLEAIDRRDVVLLQQVITADIHLLARELVAGAFQLRLG